MIGIGSYVLKEKIRDGNIAGCVRVVSCHLQVLLACLSRLEMACNIWGRLLALQREALGFPLFVLELLQVLFVGFRSAKEKKKVSLVKAKCQIFLKTILISDFLRWDWGF